VQKTLPDVHDAQKQTIERFKYNKQGQLIELRNAHSHVKRTFNAEGRLLEEDQNGFIVSNAYDVAGNRVERKTSAGNTVSVEYDLLELPITIAINDAAPITIERNALGQATLERLSPQLTRMFDYNADGLLTAQAVHKDNTPLFDTRFEYDNAGNLTKRTDSQHGEDRYSYDPMGRILAHTDPAGRVKQYLNDPAGDRLRTRVHETRMQRAVGGEAFASEWSREGEYDVGSTMRSDYRKWALC
jgi:YD repeat-containing protein